MIAWPAVQARLAELLPTLPIFAGVEVYDGPPANEERPLHYVIVGYAPDTGAGRWETETRNDYRRDERGEVVCYFVSQSGDEDIPWVRARVFALVDALDTALRADQTLGGVLSADGTCVLSAEVDSVQNASGSAQSVVVSVVYTTRS